MYGKGVFRAELQPAEVDPRFKIWPPQIAVLRIKDTPPIFGRNLSDENWRSVLVQRLRIFVLARSQDYSRYLLRGFGLVSFSQKLNSFWSQPVMSLQTSQTKIGGSVFDPWHLFFLLHDRFCSSQPSMDHWLSSSIFPFCSSFVRPSRYGNIRPNCSSHPSMV